MRRLSLILSDLYLPADAEERPVAAELPNLDWLLSLAGHRQLAPDWRLVLAAEVGRFDLLRHTPAQIAALEKYPEALANTSWLAIPVNFEARLDHVRLTPQGLLALAPQDRAAWCAEFATAFGPELSLHEAGSRAFLLMGLPALMAQSF